ncbi:hypothetical protein BASA50_006277 [Batrachochytrium salamandrivorans]|uniref:AH domain-containing protein n=1 Tax=Batrachochytrium salamandrivorans TaxID=1357716 RepID=A0ABQ8FAS4_9FUNG|nr:hypothetical protein BASA62_006894 [Batrachochytrium salamandrivorans]KAH6594803.1 hypothetical protein BASA50_006277 [Batrachochytrium salamandrivorans]KAH6597990.1 hypothetical protein BASA61_002975 [Batrachochytrium salamandrivorans]KAH9257423.1 hypothetical protein BASA81_004348 [Batrachochytrium salamandrivorans]KAH9267224.1 hypothetical protein BASA84_000766 [Batrachochytrium salamandrivorans]
MLGSVSNSVAGNSTGSNSTTGSTGSSAALSDIKATIQSSNSLPSLSSDCSINKSDTPTGPLHDDPAFSATTSNNNNNNNAAVVGDLAVTNNSAAEYNSPTEAAAVGMANATLHDSVCSNNATVGLSGPVAVDLDDDVPLGQQYIGRQRDSSGSANDGNSLQGAASIEKSISPNTTPPTAGADSPAGISDAAVASASGSAQSESDTATATNMSPASIAAAPTISSMAADSVPYQDQTHTYEDHVPEQDRTNEHEQPQSHCPDKDPPASSSHDSVQGFQLVQATGLTDTSTPAPRGSELPTYATPSPAAAVAAASSLSKMPHTDDHARPQAPSITPAAYEPEHYSPLVDNSKSKQFNQRLDYMISEFFTRQVHRLASGAPEALDRNYRVFQQRVKERLGSQWAHITSQPEVDEAIKQVQDMYDYFTRLEKMVERQKAALQKVNDVDLEMYLFYQQQCFQETFESIRKPMMQLSLSYKALVDERMPLVQSYEQYIKFLGTFREKAVGDALETMKKQQISRLELDSYGSRLGQLEEKKLKAFAKAPGTFSLGESSSAEKELNTTRQRFQDAKNKYQAMSTQMIDKAGLLVMKRDVDFSAHIRKIVEAHDWFCRGFRTPGQSIPDEAVQMPKASTLRGFGSETSFTPPQ